MGGIDNFDKMQQLIVDNVKDSQLEDMLQEVARLKFQARRLPNKGKLKKIEEAFNALGGEQTAVEQSERQASQLLVLRSQAILQSDAAFALRDAKTAARLTTSSPQPFIAMADALERLNQLEYAGEAVQQALKRTKEGPEKLQLQKRMTEVEKRISSSKEHPSDPQDSHQDMKQAWQSAPEKQDITAKVRRRPSSKQRSQKHKGQIVVPESAPAPDGTATAVNGEAARIGSCSASTLKGLSEFTTTGQSIGLRGFTTSLFASESCASTGTGRSDR